MSAGDLGVDYEGGALELLDRVDILDNECVEEGLVEVMGCCNHDLPVNAKGRACRPVERRRRQTKCTH